MDSSRYTNFPGHLRVFAILLIILFSAADLRAQDDLISRYQARRDAFEAARYDNAIQYFAAIIQEQPAFRIKESEYGGILAWQGPCHQERARASTGCLAHGDAGAGVGRGF